MLRGLLAIWILGMLQTAGLWARREFDDVDLGDRRLSERAVKIAEALAECPGGTLPGPLSDWADLKAAYRFVGNKAVTFEKLQQPHRERTHQSCCSRGEYLLIEDTTQADFTLHWSVRGLGRIGDDNGRVSTFTPLLPCALKAGEAITFR